MPSVRYSDRAPLREHGLPATVEPGCSVPALWLLVRHGITLPKPSRALHIDQNLRELQLQILARHHAELRLNSTALMAIR